MTKTTQKIGLEDLSGGLRFLILLIVSILLWVMIVYGASLHSLYSQIDDLPKRVCENVTLVEDYFAPEFRCIILPKNFRQDFNECRIVCKDRPDYNLSSYQYWEMGMYEDRNICYFKAWETRC